MLKSNPEFFQIFLKPRTLKKLGLSKKDCRRRIKYRAIRIYYNEINVMQRINVTVSVYQIKLNDTSRYKRGDQKLRGFEIGLASASYKS